MAKRKTSAKKKPAKKAVVKEEPVVELEPEPEPEQFDLGDFILEFVMGGSKNGYFTLDMVQALLPEITTEELLTVARPRSRSGNMGFVLL